MKADLQPLNLRAQGTREVVACVLKSIYTASIVGLTDLFSIVLRMYKDAVMITNIEKIVLIPFSQSRSSWMSLQHYTSLTVLSLDIFNPLVHMFNVGYLAFLSSPLLL